MKALKIWEGVPGLAGQANVNKTKCELVHKIYFCQVWFFFFFFFLKILFQNQPETIEKAKAMFEETRQFTEKHGLVPPKSENMEVRVQESHFEYIGIHPSGGVEAAFVFDVRLKRRIQDKKPRLPAGSKLEFFLTEWDNSEAILTGQYKGKMESKFGIVLEQDMLDNEDRDRRVVKFSVSMMRPKKLSYICHLSVVDANGKVLSSLQQHVVSVVDAENTASLDEAKEAFIQMVTKSEEVGL